MAVTVEKPMPLAHRLRVCAAVPGATINLSAADWRRLAMIVEYFEREEPLVQIAAMKAQQVRASERVERWVAIACAYSASAAIFDILAGPTTNLIAAIAGLLK